MYFVEVPSEIRVSSSWPIDIVGYIIGECRGIGAIFLATCHKKAERRQKVHTYKHSLQILFSGFSSFEENLLLWAGLIPVKKCITSWAFFNLTGTIRTSVCWECAPWGSSSGEGFGGDMSDILSSSSITWKLNSLPLVTASSWVVAA